LAEAGDGTIDKARIDRLERFIIEAISCQAAHLEVFQQHITLRDQLTDQPLPFGLGEIQRQRLLVAVGALKVSGLARITALGILYIRRPPMSGVVPRNLVAPP
jgi:hypothetical protein